MPGCCDTSQARKHLTDGLRRRADKAGLRLVVLNPGRPLAEQGTFDAIVHKAVGRPAGLCRMCCEVLSASL